MSLTRPDRTPPVDVAFTDLLAASMRSARSAFGSAPLFRDRRIQRDLQRYGYSVPGHAVPESSLDALRDLYSEYTALRCGVDNGHFHSSTWNGDSAADRAARAGITDALVPQIAQLTEPDRASVLPSVLQVKPSGPLSALPAHQDSSLVDESRQFGAYVWVPLTRSRRENGAMFVLPGSHRYARWPRAASEEDELHRLHGVIRRHARLIEVESGQVVIFDNALIHGSLANLSGSTRVAASCVVVPNQVDLRVAMADTDDPGMLQIHRFRAQQDGVATSCGEEPTPCPRTAISAGPVAFEGVCLVNDVLRLRAPGPRTRRSATRRG
jgi:hypothetical protein